MCDLLANPASGITRVTMVGAGPASVATLEALAVQRGLRAVAATSPSLQRGWIRLACQTREPLNGDEDAPAAHGAPDVAGSHATPCGGTFLQRVRRLLRMAIAGPFA